ncbi:MAG: MFS transporter [Alphaproteobacteria bacterium]|nr:MFS transporter [Alphaproteobacteria bacterium]
MNSRWLIILFSASALVTISLGIRQSMGLFLGPITVDLGSGRELFSFAVAIQNLLWGISSPFFGMLADRIGGWRVASLGGLLYALGLLIMSGIVTPEAMLVGNFLVGVGLGSAGMAVALGAVSRAVPDSKRPLALGVVTSLGSFGQFALVPITQLLILDYGWQMAKMSMSVVAATMIAIGYGLRGAEATTAQVAESSLGKTIRHAFSSRDYILLTAGFFVCGLHLVFITTHLPVYLRDNNIDPAIGSWALSLIGLFNIAGALFFGWIGGVTSKRVPLALIYLARTLIIAAFITFPVSGTSALIFGAAMGFVWLGTIPLTSGLIVTFFGPRYLATLYGFVFLSHQVGSFMGAWLGGRLYDILGNYDVMWALNLGAGLLAFILHMLIREKPIPMDSAAQRA